MQHFAFVMGKVGDGREVPARLHRADVIRDIFGGGETIRAALARFAQEGRGVLVYLRDGSAGVPAQRTPQAGQESEAQRDRAWREVGLGAQILKDLGVISIRNLSQSQRAFVGLSGFGIEIAANEPLPR